MAVFNPIPTFPISGEGIDATQVNRLEWDFVSSSGETQSSYEINIYDIKDTSTVVYTSGVISSSNEYHDLPANTLSNGEDYVWKATIVGNGFERTNQSFVHFKTLATATLTIDTIGSVGQFHTFTAQYTQAQGVGVKTFQWILYDENDVVIETGDIVFGTDIRQTFTGFDNNTTYKIDVTVVNQNDVTTTSSRETFTTSYTIPQDSPSIEVNPRTDRTAVEVDYSNVIQLVGNVIGTFEYVDGKFNKSLKLSDACFNVDLVTRPIPQNFTISFWIKLDSTHDGDFWRIRKNNDIRYRVGYDSNLNRFYYTRGYRTVYGNPVYEMPENFILVGINSTGVYIRTLLQDTFEKIERIDTGLTFESLYKESTEFSRTIDFNRFSDISSFTQIGTTYTSIDALINNTFQMRMV